MDKKDIKKLMLDCYDDIISNPEKYPDVIFKKVSKFKYGGGGA